MSVIQNWGQIQVQQLSEAQRKLGIIPGAFLPAGGAAGTFLSKLSAANYDVGWVGVPAPTAGRGIVVVGTTIHFAQAAAYTTGAVPFATGAATMGFDPANFFWDDAANRLGLGTNAPTDTLDVNGTARFRTMTQGSVLFAGAAGLLSQDNANLFWDDANNYLGVGLAAPAGKIDVLEAYADGLNHTTVNSLSTTTGVGGTKRGNSSNVSSTGAAAFNAGLMSGGSFAALHEGAGNVTGATRHIGLEIYVGKGAGGTGNVDSVVGLFIQPLNQNAIGTVIDSYAIFIPAAITTGAMTNRYGVYQVSTTPFNFFGGNTAFGTATFSTTIIARLERDYITNTQACYGLFCDVSNTPAAGNAQLNAGGYFLFTTGSANNWTLADLSVIGVRADVVHSGTGQISGSAIGVRALVNKANTGTIANAYGVRSIIDNNNGGGTITTAYVFFANSPVVTGTFGTWYGYYCQASGVSNGFGFYQVGTADFNYFAGSCSVGVATFSSNTMVRIEKAYAVTASAFGISAAITNTAGAAAGGSFFGGSFAFTLAGAQNYTAANTAVYGVDAQSYHNGSGTCTGVEGIRIISRKTGTGAVTTLWGLEIFLGNTNATAAITTCYGIYVNTPSTTGAVTTYYGLFINTPAGATNYGMAIAGAAALNYIAGFSAFGSTSPVNTTWALFGASTATVSSQRITRGSAAYGGTVEGDYWNDFTQKCLIGYLSGMKQFDVRATFVQTDDKTITNTNVETTLFGAGLGTLTFPANFFVVGKTVRIKLVGVLTQPVAGPNWTWRVKLGGVTLATSAAVTHAAETNRVWLMEFLLTCRTTGAGGTVIGQGGVYHYETGGPASVALAELPMTATAALDTTAARTLDVTLQLSAADAGQSNLTTNATVEVIA